jgi:hypothetical protein
MNVAQSAPYEGMRRHLLDSTWSKDPTMSYGREGRTSIERSDRRTLTLDDTATASHPGQLRVSLWRWSLRYPKWPMIVGGSLLLTLALIFAAHLLFVIALPIALIVNYLYWFRIREHFMHGDANPGVVVSSSPLLIAVRTDMTKGEDSYPMLRIVQEQPSSRWGQPAEVGMRVATVGLYEEGKTEGLPHWECFEPHPVEPVAGHPEEARALLASFESEQWEQLERAVLEVDPPREGLFPVGS